MELTDTLKERFLSVDPATVGHYINGGFMRPEMKPIRRDDKRMIGPAYTVRISGRDSCALYYGIKHAPKGSVIKPLHAAERWWQPMLRDREWPEL